MPVHSTCVHTRLRGRGHRLHTVIQWFCDSFLWTWGMLLVLGWLNYLPPFAGNILRILKKNKNSRSWSEIWPMPLNLFSCFLASNTRLPLPALCLSVFSFMPGCLPTWAPLRACFLCERNTCVSLSARTRNYFYGEKEQLLLNYRQTLLSENCCSCR